METFAWRPVNQPSGDITLRVRTAQFGDGYAQAAGDGINGKEQSWPLTFVAKTKAEALAILDFFDRHAGYKSFFWTPPLGEIGLYRVSEYTSTPVGADVYTIAATFAQAFAP